jgi:O-antigen ligase
VWSAFENRLAQFRNAPGPRYAHAHNAWLDWALQLGIGGLLLYVLFLGVLLVRAVVCARLGAGFATGVSAVCLLVYIQIYDLANVSTVPITRFGFFMLAVSSASLWMGLASGRYDKEEVPATEAK